MIYRSSLFKHFSACQLVTHLATHLAKNLNSIDNHLIDSKTKHTAWQVCWLNNDDHPVIGLLPKVSWTVFPVTHQGLRSRQRNAASPPTVPLSSTSSVPITVVKTIRQSLLNTLTTPIYEETLTTYDEWRQTLIAYAQANADCQQHKNNTKHEKAFSQINRLHNRSQDTPLTHTYHHGLMGFIGYDIGAKALSPASAIELAEQPCAFLGYYDIYLAQTEHGWQLHGHVDTDTHLLAGVHTLLQRIEDAHNQSKSTDLPTPSLRLSRQWQFTHYKSAFVQTQEYLHNGDSYQINLTQKWHGQLNKSLTSSTDRLSSPIQLVNYLSKLYHNTKAPFSGYLSIINNSILPNSNDIDNFELLSCSPELFLMFTNEPDGSHTVTTKPIKGTRPRGHNAQSDKHLKNELQNSDKDRAENVMIVDLLRNDLGKYAKTGSVHVPNLFAIESFSNVHHMVSTVTATIKEEVHPLTVLFDSLPAGSITGAPKKRAVEIISELEVESRGAYCGTMGYMNFDGSGQWNVLIRTLQASNKQVNLWAGGGITVGSECEAEYQECLDKIDNLLAVLANNDD